MPGTRSDLALRVVQFVSATLAVIAMTRADDFSDASAFSFLVAACSLQTLWSFMLAVLDIVVMVSHYPLLVDHLVASKVIFGDVRLHFDPRNCLPWFPQITGMLTFCSSTASCGMVVYLHYDIETCATEHCTQFQNATKMAFISVAAVVPSLIINYISL
ncbi:hypothetical protein PVAP13_1NG193800 [Panicum virgatum]|uniref:CASP-like protein n=1 Tax=Panicum virgatum TaxID=38727 RepID=A0A8T0WVF5_PANVG|nr:hypothetical protein PVAP13_1NG193800 [Panicum virgatum]KAG2649647.1 hypothetical protein PVAP13_1NG193800 [Panicum virgatum]